MKILVVVGARPNFMKAAPLLEACEKAGVGHVLVHTGQHYDRNMSNAFFADLHLPQPDHDLGVGSGTHAYQTAMVMLRLEPILEREDPDWVVVVGDVNSTLAAALTARKLSSTSRPRVCHLEAGLRSRSPEMPEEVNRVLTDHLSDLLLTPSADASANLENEGIEPGKIRMVGNIMVDSLLRALPLARERARELGMAGDASERPHVVVTLHRPSNVDHPDRLGTILKGLANLASLAQVYFPIHPRTASRIEEYRLESLLDGMLVTEPVGYLEMVAWLDRADAVVTDSGGIQEETTVLGVPCITVRESTERPITLTLGTNRLVPWPPASSSITEAAMAALKGPRESRRPPLWDGETAARCVEALMEGATR